MTLDASAMAAPHSVPNTDCVVDAQPVAKDKHRVVDSTKDKSLGRPVALLSIPRHFDRLPAVHNGECRPGRDGDLEHVVCEADYPR